MSKTEWIPVWEGQEEMKTRGLLPEVDEDGVSDFILLSFSNFGGLCIGYYEEDENGGTFYDGDSEEPLTSIGFFVNAWMPLPKPYRPWEED